MTTDELMAKIDVYVAYMASNNTQQQAFWERNALRAAIESLAADAARYCWLRDVGGVYWSALCKRAGQSASEIDDAIDASIGNP